MNSLQKNIESLIEQQPPGAIFFPSSFNGLGTSENLKKILLRMTGKGLIKRAAHGIYYKPEVHEKFGELHPSADQIVKMIADKERVKVRETGAAALNKLGLSTQVPMNAVYITDGPPRRLKIGNQKVTLKRVGQKKLATKGPISSLIILALDALDLDHIERGAENRIKELLLLETKENLQHDILLAPQKINNYIVNLLKRKL